MLFLLCEVPWFGVFKDGQKDFRENPGLRGSPKNPTAPFTVAV